MVVQFCDGCGNLLDESADETIQYELCGRTNILISSYPTPPLPPSQLTQKTQTWHYSTRKPQHQQTSPHASGPNYNNSRRT
ncbi:hypothetical protein BJY00DRAFT_284117 [Aspergillus carlsbadensis]|nr:hypothetical protein BJY00DRAFT_284117 [Aspergillus carlsbadensis]